MCVGISTCSQKSYFEGEADKKTNSLYVKVPFIVPGREHFNLWLVLFIKITFVEE